MMDSSKAITQLGVQLVIEAPFFGHLLAGMLKQKGGAERAALTVAEGYQPLLLLGAPLFSEGGLSPAQRLGVLKHELLHLLFHHPLLLDRAGDRRLFHLAADLVVNQYLTAAELPTDAIRLNQVEALKPEPWRPVWYYYELLIQGVREESPAVQRLIAAADGLQAELHRHRYWEPLILSLDAAGAALFQDTVAELARTTVGRTGLQALPAPLPAALRQAYLQREPSVDWRRILRLFAATSRRTRVRNTLRRPSRRYGTAPGIKVKRRSRLLVAIDTSASVSAEQLQGFWTEIHLLWRLGHELFIVENDTLIRSQLQYRGQMPRFAWGRGGTDYNAPLRLANERLHPDGLVFFTDGEGPAPSVRCRYPLLWVVAGRQAGRSLPGRKVMMVFND